MNREEFSQALGFETYDELMRKSEVVVTEKGASWYITMLPDGCCAAWKNNDYHMNVFDNDIEAIGYLYDEVVAAGYSGNHFNDPISEQYQVSAYQDDYGEWIVKAYGHRFCAGECDDEDQAISLILDGRGEHDPACPCMNRQ